MREIITLGFNFYLKSKNLFYDKYKKKKKII